MTTELIPDATLPAEGTSAGGEAVDSKLSSTKHRRLGALGPGLITGASDDDPSGIGTYAVAGARFGFVLLWMAPIAIPLMIAIQYMCAKIGLVCGRGLAGVLRGYYPRWVLYLAVTALVVANTINAGVDIGAVASGINLLVPLPALALVVPIGVIILVLQFFGSYGLIVRVFKWMTLALFAYLGAAILAHPDFGTVIKSTFVPTVRLDRAFLTVIMAILGTTISPYLFFWEASEEVEEEIAHGRRLLLQRQGATDSELRGAAWDTSIGMVMAVVVMHAIMLATAATLHQAGQTEIRSATEAAEALRPLAGDASTLLFALGLIGSGFLAIPVLTGAAAYAVSETFDWNEGLGEKPRRAKGFYSVIAASTLIGMLVNYLGINPISALFWTAVINGLLAPPLLVLVMLVVNNEEIMGGRVNGPILNILGWATAAAMFLAAFGFFLV
jgi:NRAMP (natural resistance-associated macrophage protein)-like metal ion transporter